MAKRNLSEYVGRSFGSWTITGIDSTIRGKKTFYVCTCACGTQRTILPYDLFNEKTSSCGCQKTAKRESSCIEKYGTTSPAKNLIIQEKIKKTNLNKYGHACSFQSPDVIEKTKTTNLAKYGTCVALDSSIVQGKIKQTMMEKYGTENPSCVPEIQEKRLATFRERFNKDNPSQDPEIANKISVSIRSDAVQEKTKATVLNKFGSEYVFTSEYFLKLAESNDWTTSKGEAELLAFVQTLTEAKKYHIARNEIDVYAIQNKIGFEYNGMYWHSEAVIDKQYHKNKTDAMKKQGIKIIHIFEYEWQTKKDQIKSRIKSLIQKNSIKVSARKCEIKEVLKQEARDFLSKTHIQGAPSGSVISFGLFLNNKLVALATFGKHHRKSSQIVLSRFVCLPDHTVRGGLSRLSLYASRFFKQNIISWCDLRWSDGNGYVAAGWKQEEILRPDYFYTNGRKIISKQSRKKTAVNTPDGMTEHEHALADGLFRIYDCGKVRYVYTYKPDGVYS